MPFEGSCHLEFVPGLVSTLTTVPVLAAIADRVDTRRFAMGAIVSSLAHSLTGPKVGSRCHRSTRIHMRLRLTARWLDSDLLCHADHRGRDPSGFGHNRWTVAGKSNRRVVRFTTSRCLFPCLLRGFSSAGSQVPPAFHRYPTLDKPSWTPPAPLFGNLWSVFYTVMGYASYLVWKQGGLAAQKRPLTFYGLQLFFNLMWPITFFLRKKLGQGQVVNLSEF